MQNSEGKHEREDPACNMQCMLGIVIVFARLHSAEVLVA